MNLERIIIVTSSYLFLTGYQIRWYDRKSLKYRLTVCGFFYCLIIFLFYLICFCHHFESSSLLKILLDISPFLKDLVCLQVILGLKVYLICILEAKSLTKISNSLICILKEEIKRQGTFDFFEVLIYLMFFATLMAVIAIGLYIAIELKGELPPLDHIMIGMALFMPHFTLAGCLRLYTLGLWLIKRELVIMRTICKEKEEETGSRILQCSVVLEISNPASIANSNEVVLYGAYDKISNRLDFIAECLKLLDSILQRQLSVLVGMNFNCLLAGIYTHVYFENFWKALFTNRNRRIFYAANSAIFICILMDYAILLFTRWGFCRAKQTLYNMFEAQLFGNKNIELEMKAVLQFIMYKLSKKFELKLMGLVKFNAWNFLVLQGLLILIIALIVSHQYLHDQIKVLNERLDVNDSE